MTRTTREERRKEFRDGREESNPWRTEQCSECLVITHVWRLLLRDGKWLHRQPCTDLSYAPEDYAWVKDHPRTL